MGSLNTAKVALITGGASGFGLAVATALIQRGNWHVHLLDLNEKSGQAAAESLGSSATFHKVNATVYDELAATFDKVFRAEGRLDFVFGNAGIVERFNFYDTHAGSGPPPPLDMRVVEINLKAVYTTSYLALHYFRLSPAGTDRSLVLTASCGGLYGCPGSAMYAGTKHGVVGFMRSIAGRYMSDNIRVNAICPGTVATGLLEAEAWKSFPQQFLTPVSTIVDTVLKLVDGSAVSDAKGLHVNDGELYGKAVEININNFYFRDQHEFCDDAMASVMGSTNRDFIKPTKQSL